jgi:hypothetical protein
VAPHRRGELPDEREPNGKSEQPAIQSLLLRSVSALSTLANGGEVPRLHDCSIW